MNTTPSLFSPPDRAASDDAQGPAMVEAKPFPARRRGTVTGPCTGASKATKDDAASASAASRLSREQVMDRIIMINPTATTRFLGQFAQPDLVRYLDHLTASRTPRGRDAVWSRPGDSPAIVSRRTVA